MPREFAGWLPLSPGSPGCSQPAAAPDFTRCPLAGSPLPEQSTTSTHRKPSAVPLRDGRRFFVLGSSPPPIVSPHGHLGHFRKVGDVTKRVEYCYATPGASVPSKSSKTGPSCLTRGL